MTLTHITTASSTVALLRARASVFDVFNIPQQQNVVFACDLMYCL